MSIYYVFLASVRIDGKLKLFEEAIIHKFNLIFMDNDDGMVKSIKHEGVLLVVLQFFKDLFKVLGVYG